MRLAFSTMAATSGLILLALAVYGDPSDYMLQARNAWQSLLKSHVSMARSPSDRGQPIASRDARFQAIDAEAIERLQHEVDVLQQRLAAPAASARPSEPMAPSGSAQQLGKQGNTPPLQDSVTRMTIRRDDIAAAPRVSSPSIAGAPQQVPQSASTDNAVEAASPTDMPTPGEQADASAPGKSMTRATTASPKAALSRKRLRSQIEDMRSVLTRLRQNSAPSPTEASPPAQTPLPPPASPALPRLMAAQAAIMAGRIDDAVRLLQEAQLQLVFRPVDTPGGAPEAAGQGASAVAHALEALSANQPQACQQFINQAVTDLNGVHTRSSTGYVSMNPTGYAPAYPPH